jgi:hypothetical protein
MPPLRLQASQARSIADAIVADLQRDPSLRANDPVWRLPDGPGFDDEPPVDRLTIQVTPKVKASSRVSVLGYGRTLSEVTVEIEFAIRTPGTSPTWADMSAAWDAIDRRITRRREQFTAKQEHDADMSAMGVHDFEFRQPADWGQPGILTVVYHQES